MGLLRQSLKRILEHTLPPSALLPSGRQRRVSSDPPGLSLTFDDGPHPEFTPRLLDQLAAVGIRATFFVVGQQAQKFPGLIRRMAAEGHEVGNHTWTHSEPSRTSARDFLREVRETRLLLEDLTGKPSRLMRPPKGELSLLKLSGLLRLRQTLVLWNRDPRDYAMESWADMEEWCRTYLPEHGDIVLMHDNRPHCVTAVALLGTVSPAADCRFVTVSEWLARNDARECVSSGGVMGSQSRSD